MNCKICQLDQRSQYILHGSKAQRSESRGRRNDVEKNEKEQSRSELNFRGELYNVDAVAGGLNSIIFYHVWDENMLSLKNCSMGL